MYFDIFALVSAKRNTFAINCQTAVVTSLRTASLDHHRLTGVPQIDTSWFWLDQRFPLHAENNLEKREFLLQAIWFETRTASGDLLSLAKESEERMSICGSSEKNIDE